MQKTRQLELRVAKTRQRRVLRRLHAFKTLRREQRTTARLHEQRAALFRANHLSQKTVFSWLQYLVSRKKKAVLDAVSRLHVQEGFFKSFRVFSGRKRRSKQIKKFSGETFLARVGTQVLEVWRAWLETRKSKKQEYAAAYARYAAALRKRGLAAALRREREVVLERAAIAKEAAWERFRLLKPVFRAWRAVRSADDWLAQQLLTAPGSLPRDFSVAAVGGSCDDADAKLRSSPIELPKAVQAACQAALEETHVAVRRDQQASPPAPEKASSSRLFECLQFFADSARTESSMSRSTPLPGEQGGRGAEGQPLATSSSSSVQVNTDDDVHAYATSSSSSSPYGTTSTSVAAPPVLPVVVQNTDRPSPLKADSVASFSTATGGAPSGDSVGGYSASSSSRVVVPGSSPSTFPPASARSMREEVSAGWGSIREEASDEDSMVLRESVDSTVVPQNDRSARGPPRLRIPKRKPGTTLLDSPSPEFSADAEDSGDGECNGAPSNRVIRVLGKVEAANAGARGVDPTCFGEVFRPRTRPAPRIPDSLVDLRRDAG